VQATVKVDLKWTAFGTLASAQPGPAESRQAEL